MTAYDDRRSRVREGLPDDLAALLVTTPANVRYLSGFTGSNGQLLLASESGFFTDGRYDEQSSVQVPDLDRQIYTAGTKLTDLLGKALADRGTTKIGIEASNVTLQTMERLRSGLSGIDLVETTDVVETVRRCKDTEEIHAIRTAQRIAEDAVTRVLRDFTDGSEADLALELEMRIRRSGADGVSFEVIVATGPHSALPHATPRREPADLDTVLLIDIGAQVDGYASDMTRTYLGPRAPEEMRKVFDAVRASLEAGCAALRPGVKCADVDRACREVLEEAGYGQYFSHSTGHGVGLDIHEAPSLTTTSEETLEPGMMVTIEPGVYLPGVGGVRIEDLLVVTDDGAENLTALDRGSQLPS